MNNKFYITLLISFSLLSCYKTTNENGLNCVQIVDRNGLSETISASEKLSTFEQIDFTISQPYKRVLRIYNKNGQGSTPSILTTYHPNGLIWKYLEIRDARANGIYKEWHPNGNLKIEATVIGGTADVASQEDWLFDGVCKAYDENKVILSDITYLKGVLHGISNYYYSNGQLKKTIPYINNEISGEVLEYKENGDLYSKSYFKNNLKHGPSLTYWELNNICSIEDYENDVLQNGKYFKNNRIIIASIKHGDGQKAIFDEEKLIKLIEFKNGMLDGKVQEFSTNGELEKEYFIKNNMKQGEEIIYYLKNELQNNFIKGKNNPKISFTWDNNLIHGAVKTWYKSGQLESQKEFSNNKKNGMNCAWYESGDLMFIEEYENDILTKGSYYRVNSKEPITKIVNGNGTATLYDRKGIFLKKIEYLNGLPQD